MRAGDKTRHAVGEGGKPPEAPHPEYPRPKLVRSEWAPLNGLWDYAIAPIGSPQPAVWDGKILVPFAVQSALSGVGKLPKETDRLAYHRSFEAPERVARPTRLLHFGAVDYETTVSLNGHVIGQHRGGYDAFSFDGPRCSTKVDRRTFVVSVI